MSGDGVEKSVEVLDDRHSYAGIPEAEFIEDMNAFMAKPENNVAEAVLRRLDEQHSKYKFMELNLMSKYRRLKSQIPDLKLSLVMIERLRRERDGFDTQFLLSEQVFAKAHVAPTDTVCLWLGANVMLEYSLDDAEALLSKNADSATRTLDQVQHDLDFVKGQYTTTEVNMSRVLNWNVLKRKAEETG